MLENLDLVVLAVDECVDDGWVCRRRRGKQRAMTEEEEALVFLERCAGFGFSFCSLRSGACGWLLPDVLRAAERVTRSSRACEARELLNGA